MLRTRSASAWGFFGLTLVNYALLVAGADRVTSPAFPVTTVRAVFVVLVALQCLAAGGMFVVNRSVMFRWLYIGHVAAGATTLLLFVHPVELVIAWLVVNVVPAGAYEEYPANVLFATGAVTALLLIAFVTHRWPVATLVTVGAVGWSTAIVFALFGRYRERTLRQRIYINELEDNVTALTRANYLSQEYAKSIEEESRSAERRRMTRDIHDAVGYTLTNSIMMLEAVKVMTQAEPAKVPGYLETIRQNIESGLTEIKRTLRDVRARETPRETVFWAIKRLIQVFTTSTRVEVTVESGNTTWEDLEIHAGCVYHFVQEALINAFRHGRATRVTIVLWDHGDEICVSVVDDGAGSDKPPKPNIGIAGMLERADAAGGRIIVNNHVGGFHISLFVPKRPKEGPKDADSQS